MIDYVIERMGEAPTATFPQTFAAALGWFEARAGFPRESRLACNDQFRRVVERAKADAGEAHEEIRRAPRFPVSLIAALEVAVVDEALLPRGLRVVAWARLVKIFGVLRTDDLQRLRPENVKMGEAGLVAKLLRTKCTGPGKKVRELTVFVPAEASVAGTKWLHVGYELWLGSVPKGLDFFLPRLSKDMKFFVPKVPTSSDLAGMFTQVLLTVRQPVEGDGGLVPGQAAMLDESMAVSWTGHSERSSLPSLAATLGVPKMERDYLGRWSPSGSDEYVRTYRSIMKKTMGVLLEAVKGDSPYQALDEAEAYEAATAVMIRKGIDEETASAACEVAKSRARSVFGLLWGQTDQSPPKTGLSGAARLPEVPDTIEEQRGEEREEEKAKFVVSVGNKKRKGGAVDCLHRRDGCWRGRGLVFSSYELIFDDPPDSNSYSEVCKTCWPSGRPAFPRGEAKSDDSDEESSSSTSAGWSSL